MPHPFAAVLLTAVLPAVAAAQTVTITLSAPQAGQTVVPGAAIDWQIAFSVSAGDNDGLALLITDLVQDPANPALLDIPPADGVPSGMSNFSRPAGICNPGETDPLTGYIGVQRGAAGQKNLRQIGGAQNTFGQAFPPGSGVGENADVISGVGQAGAEVLASGSFVAPATCGAYTFRLENPLANVIVQRFDPPAFSPVIQATVDATAGSFSFTVGLPGDVDGDGDVDLSDLAILLSTYGACAGDPNYLPSADLDGNGCVGLEDLALELAHYGQTCQ